MPEGVSARSMSVVVPRDYNSASCFEIVTDPFLRHRYGEEGLVWR